ncbi:CAP domain-containing protein [Halosegnis marinus]|uniref:CAP domain-containing protein n=1 Tax=Halosegnis marinus TaxID=3034023 RepID=UPI00360DF745
MAAVADAHSADMAARDYVNHTAPNGSGVAERYERFGIDCFGSENIYYTPNGALLVSERTLAERVVAEWLDSPGHRETLLGNFSRQGIGVVVAGDGGVYVTQNVCWFVLRSTVP